MKSPLIRILLFFLFDTVFIFSVKGQVYGQNPATTAKADSIGKFTISNQTIETNFNYIPNSYYGGDFTGEILKYGNSISLGILKLKSDFMILSSQSGDYKSTDVLYGFSFDAPSFQNNLRKELINKYSKQANVPFSNDMVLHQFDSVRHVLNNVDSLNKTDSIQGAYAKMQSELSNGLAVDSAKLLEMEAYLQKRKNLVFSYDTLLNKIKNYEALKSLNKINPSDSIRNYVNGLDKNELKDLAKAESLLKGPEKFFNYIDELKVGKYTMNYSPLFSNAFYLNGVSIAMSKNNLFSSFSYGKYVTGSYTSFYPSLNSTFKNESASLLYSFGMGRMDDTHLHIGYADCGLNSGYLFNQENQKSYDRERIVFADFKLLNIKRLVLNGTFAIPISAESHVVETNSYNKNFLSLNANYNILNGLVLTCRYEYKGNYFPYYFNPYIAAGSENLSAGISGRVSKKSLLALNYLQIKYNNLQQQYYPVTRGYNLRYTYNLKNISVGLINNVLVNETRTTETNYSNCQVTYGLESMIRHRMIGCQSTTFINGNLLNNFFKYTSYHTIRTGYRGSLGNITNLSKKLSIENQVGGNWEESYGTSYSIMSGICITTIKNLQARFNLQYSSDSYSNSYLQYNLNIKLSVTKNLAAALALNHQLGINSVHKNNGFYNPSWINTTVQYHFN